MMWIQNLKLLTAKGPYNYQKALYTGKHLELPKST